MFVIEKLFIEDKQLPKVLYAVTGLVYKMEPPRPVVNAVAKNGNLKQASSATSLKDQMFEWASHLKGKQITSKDVKEQVKTFGGAESSAYYVTTELIKAKLMKRKANGVFTVL